MKEEFDLGGRIRFLRKYKNLSQKELADLIGVTAQTVHKYERGYRVPTADILIKIGELLDCNDFGWLLTGQNSTISDVGSICPVACNEEMQLLCARIKGLMESDKKLGSFIESSLYMIEEIVQIKNVTKSTD